MVSLQHIRVLAVNTFREAIRDRILYSILFFGVGVILLSLVMQEITIGDQDKVVRSAAQAAVDLFSSIIAMFLGVSLVWKELERKTAYNVLSKPITRLDFVLGKYAGLVLTLAVQVAIMTAVYAALMTVQQTFPPLVVFISMGLLLVELMLLCSWATLFSTFAAPTSAAFFTLATFVIGHLADDVWLYGSRADSEAVRKLARVVYWALPNFEVFNIREQAVHNMPVPWDQVGAATGYGVAYTAAVLAIAIAIFNRRDLP